MSDEPVSADELDDAAFRARLAPLALEVLPARSGTSTVGSPSRRRNGRVNGGIAVGIALLGVAGLVSLWGMSDRATGRRSPGMDAPVARPDPAIDNRTRDAPPPATPHDSSTEMTDMLLRRGNAAIADGDIVAARLLFERAAAMGSATAATAMGRTYDMEVLLRSGVRGIRADQNTAAAWYRKAAELGDAEARARLARIGTRP